MKTNDDQAMAIVVSFVFLPNVCFCFFALTYILYVSELEEGDHLPHFFIEKMAHRVVLCELSLSLSLVLGLLLFISRVVRFGLECVPCSLDRVLAALSLRMRPLCGTPPLTAVARLICWTRWLSLRWEPRVGLGPPRCCCVAYRRHPVILSWPSVVSNFGCGAVRSLLGVLSVVLTYHRVIGRDRQSQGGPVEQPPATTSRSFQAADGHRQDSEAPGARGDGLGAEGKELINLHRSRPAKASKQAGRQKVIMLVLFLVVASLKDGHCPRFCGRFLPFPPTLVSYKAFKY